MGPATPHTPPQRVADTRRQPIRLSALFEEFCHFLRVEKEVTPATIATYRWCFGDFLAFVMKLVGGTAVQGKYEEGLTHIRRGLTQWEAAGSRLLQPYALATLAGVYLQSGQPALGLALVEEALSMVNVTGESWYEAELYRLQGELTLAEFHGPDREARAEVIWRNALAVARGQDARSWELRVSMSLARLWERQGKRQEARNLLAPIYGWFTEGHDTEDLKQAKTLLDAMS